MPVLPRVSAKWATGFGQYERGGLKHKHVEANQTFLMNIYSKYIGLTLVGFLRLILQISRL